MPGTVGIIDTITGVPLGLLHPLVDHNGPFTGNNIRDTWLDGSTVKPVSNTFGCVIDISGAIAPKLGRFSGVDDGGSLVLDTFTERIVQVAVIHQLFGGAYIASQVVDVFYTPFLIRWAESLPGRIGLKVSPDWAIDVYYLQAL